MAVWGAKRLLLFGALAVATAGCGGSEKNERPFHEISLTNADQLVHTVVTTDWEAPIESGRNLIYCATFQLAWNSLIDDVVAEPVKLEGDPPLAQVLNKRLVEKSDLTDDCYVALAGLAKNGILDRVNTALESKFGEAAPVEGMALRPEDILAYAFLLKDMPFEIPFEILDEPIRFQSARGVVPVQGFGIESGGGGRKAKKICRQVKVISYMHPMTCIELKTKAAEDEVILALVEPEEDLLSTVKTVLAIVDSAGQARNLKPDARLSIPVVEFHVRKEYEEVVDVPLRNEGFHEYWIAEAIQDIRFRMDERGLHLRSRAHFLVTASMPMRIVFDRPFLLYIRKRGAALPFFAAWIEDPEILVPAEGD